MMAQIEQPRTAAPDSGHVTDRGFACVADRCRAAAKESVEVGECSAWDGRAKYRDGGDNAPGNTAIRKSRSNEGFSNSFRHD